MDKIKVELGCKGCKKTFELLVDDEMYDNDYDVICQNCGKEQSLSSYDYFPLM